MKQLNLLLSFLFLSTIAFAQGSVKGQITDAETGESLIGANVVVGTNGVTSNFDGNYVLKLAKGKHEVKFSYIGFEDVIENITIDNQDITLNIKMGGALELQAITVTADIAVARKTPVAFTNISTEKLNEELASQDLPMLLNSTPGAYATQTGGGDGDARVSIRGFDQRNIAVMLDGIPVNDMENGWVYWSNWFGLDLVTKTMQVQRGLGASKLAIPSVGGTINILTKGIESKREFRFQQELGNNGFTRSTLGFTSGRMKNGWGVSAAGSYKQGDGWANGNFTEGYFYYLRVDKEIGNHLISFSGFGAPQQHGQRAYKAPVAIFDSTYAGNLGVANDEFPQTGYGYGLRHNQHVGVLNGEMVNTQVNYYHKPQFSLRHSWNASDRFFLSNVAYLSIGNGGGTRTRGSLFGDDDRMDNGLFDLDAVYAQNQTPTLFNPDGRAENFLFSSMNSHFWYGLLSTAEFTMNDNWTFSGGLDLRNYEGGHRREVYDLMGGNYVSNSGTNRNKRIENGTQLGVGDVIDYDYTGYVRWGGLFGMAEYEKDGLSAFINVSTAMSAYAYEDFFNEKIVTLADTSFEIAHGETVTIDDNNYTTDSPEAENYRIDWLYRPSFTIKTGAAYRINKRHGVFFNTGYLSRPTRYSNVIIPNATNRQDAIVAEGAKNEIVTSFELGYNFKSPRFAANVNTYYTNWTNRPLDRLPSVLEDPTDPESDRTPVNIQGLAALHQGIEIDFAFEATDELTLEGLASIGDWIWNSGDTVLLPDGVTTYEFDPTGVHVGDAAQIQLGGLIRYAPEFKALKGLYIKLKATHFAKYYADFNPEDLRGATARAESWQIPNYTLFDFHTGYTFSIYNKKTDKRVTKVNIRFNILNLLDAVYVSDAQNNDAFTQSFNTFDARSSAVFLGQGRQWRTSINFTF
jgi:hypothetical protein